MTTDQAIGPENLKPMVREQRCILRFPNEEKAFLREETDIVNMSHVKSDWVREWDIHDVGDIRGPSFSR